MNRTSRLAGWLLLMSGLLAGCSGLGTAPAGAPPGRTEEPKPAAPPTSAPGARDQGAAGQSSAQTGSQLAPTGIVKLIPYKAEVGFTMMTPEGWNVEATLSGDRVTFYSKSVPVQILVHTWQRRGAAVPHTVEDMKRRREGKAAVAQVKQVKIDGAESAFEIRETSDNGEMTHLTLLMFGSTWQETLWIQVPTNLYSQWEPVCRQIIQSFQPTDLNAEEMPGRP